MLIYLPFLTSCDSSTKVAESDSAADTFTADSADAFWDSGDTETGEQDSAQERYDPWPDDEVNWENVISVVYDGQLISSQDTLRFSTAPAGFNHESRIQLTLTNRSALTLQLDVNPLAWIDAEGFEWASAVPDSVEPQESIILELAFNPVSLTEEQTLSARLTVPMSEDDFNIDIEAIIPPPLRMIFVGDNGYTLVSDSYGTTFSHEQVPQDIGQTMLTAAWGNGYFIRGSRFGGWSADGHYEYSTNGVNWNTAFVAGANFPFACDYGFDEFVCVRGYGAYFNHSTDPTIFLHNLSILVSIPL